MDHSVESYSLIEERLPTIPVPHDCVVKEIALREDWLILSFEDGIARHDAVRYRHPTAHTLTMKIHCLDEQDIEILAYERRKCEEVYVLKSQKDLFDLPNVGRKLEYLNHMVSCGDIQLELFGDKPVVVRLDADQVVLEWEEDSQICRG